MDHHFQHPFTFDLFDGVATPTYSNYEDPTAWPVAMQSSIHSTADVDSAPNPMMPQHAPQLLQYPTTQHAPPLLQDPTSQQYPVPQQDSLSLGNSEMFKAQSDHSRQQVTKQMGWSSEPHEHDWEQHKQRITELYSDRTLERVMEIMKREHGLKASIKMYKDRFRKWRIDKNIKGEEMKAIIRKQTQRSRVGKKSAFRIRNSRVPESKIIRCRKSKGLSSEIQALQLRAPTPAELICYTPLASPLSTPRVLETPERIAKLVQQYVHGSFESRTWLVTNDEDCVSIKESDKINSEFRVHNMNALLCLYDGEMNAAWSFLSMAMALVEQVVAEEGPDTLDILCTIVLGYVFNHFGVVSSVLLRQFSAMSAKTMRRKHPFNYMFAHLIEQDVSDLKHTIDIARQSQIDCFTQRSGRFNRTTLELQVSRLRSMKKVNNLRFKGFVSLSQEIEYALGASNIRSLQVRLDLAWQYKITGQYEKAVELTQSIMTLVAPEKSSGMKSAFCEALYILAEIHHRLAKADLAEQNIRHAILTRAGYFGWKDGDLLYMMSDLARWLEEWERPDEAAEVRRQMDEIISSKYEKFRSEEDEKYRRWEASRA